MLKVLRRPHSQQLLHCLLLQLTVFPMNLAHRSDYPQQQARYFLMMNFHKVNVLPWQKAIPLKSWEHQIQTILTGVEGGRMFFFVCVFSVREGVIPAITVT